MGEPMTPERIAALREQCKVLDSDDYKISYTLVIDELAFLGEEVPDLLDEIERLRTQLADAHACIQDLELDFAALEHERDAMYRGWVDTLALAFGLERASMEKS